MLDLDEIERHELAEGELLKKGGALLQAQQVALSIVPRVQFLPHILGVIVGVVLPEVHILAASTHQYIFCSKCSFC